MAVLNTGLAKVSGEAFTIDQSLRFNSADDAYLSRTPSSASNRTTWTWSGWVKRGNFNADSRHNMIFSSSVTSSSTNMCTLQFNNGYSNGVEFIDFYFHNGTTDTFLRPLPALRDPSGWYHIVVAVDTTQVTDTDRVNMYVNGVKQTTFVTGYEQYPPQDAVSHINNTEQHWIGHYAHDISQDRGIDGYLAEIHMIDGVQLTASSFGETGDYGEWKPKAYDTADGAYGTNGYYLDFADSGNLGDDESGNGNDFSNTNLVASDQMLDSPTNNFATLNPLYPSLRVI